MVKGRIMGNKIKRLLVTLGIIFLTANWAMAGNNVQLQTDVPDIPQSSCDQAGNIVMLFESGAQMEEGDTITFSLTNNVSVCQPINFFLRLAGSGSEQLINNTSLPVYDTSGTAGVGDWLYTGDTISGAIYGNPMTDNGTQFDVGFRVYAPAGSQTITLTLGRRILATTSGGITIGTFYAGNMPAPTNGKFRIYYTPDENDNKMVLRLFDQKVTSPYFWKDDSITTGTQYTQAFASTDDKENALCINTSLLNVTTNEYVLATPKSTVSNDSYKLSFTGDYYIAHITTQDVFSLGLACKDDCPTISKGTSTDQWGNVTTPSGMFDPGNYNSGITSSERWTSSGTCENSYGNGIKISRSGTNFDNATKYQVTAQLYINGNAASSSTLYWNSGNTGGGAYQGLSSDSGKCAAAGTAWTSASAGTWTRDTADITKTSITITAVSGYDTFMLDLPIVNYAYQYLNTNDEIQVYLTFGKYPCGANATTTVCIGKVVAQCTSTSSTYELYFPFAKNSGDTDFWSAIGVMNLSSSTATAMITLYDANGGSGVLSNVSINSYGMYAKSIADIIADPSFVPSTSPAFSSTADLIVKIGADYRIDGLCFIGTYSMQMLHGYLPRVYYSSSPIH